MTQDEAIREVCRLAFDQVGYKEGPDNYNKYAADPLVTKAIGWDVQNQPWCATFVVAMFIECFGYYSGKAMMYGCSASCAQQAGFYQSNAAFYSSPQKGDQIFFIYDGGINHTGIVIDVSGSTITTVEGNYSDSVCENTYFVGDTTIAGYGRPCWDIVASDDPDDPVDPADMDRAAPIVQYPDGVGGHPSNLVRAWQTFLDLWGFDLGIWGVDGEFGLTTAARTKELQKCVGLEATGIVDEATWQQGILVPVRK